MTSKRGRPPEPESKRQYATRFPRDVIAFLRQLPNAAHWLMKLIRRSKDYREWRK